MKKVIIISGPTGVGKTSFSIGLAKKLGGEIISADSMQIYRKMDIGTDKASPEDQKKVAHHLLDIVNPDEEYSVQDYQRAAYEKIDQIHARGKTPLIVGGTGLYIDSLLYDFKFASSKPDLDFRRRLEEVYEERGGAYLLEKVKEVDPKTYETLNEKDKKKIIRALEIYETTGQRLSETKKENVLSDRYDFYAYVFTNDREILYENINKRVDQMIDQGLVEEVDQVMKAYSLTEESQSMKAIGYREVVPYLRGDIDLDTMAEDIKKDSRRYAKRQLTWFRRNPHVKWIDKGIYDSDEKILSFILNDLEGDENEF